MVVAGYLWSMLGEYVGVIHEPDGLALIGSLFSGSTMLQRKRIRSNNSPADVVVFVEASGASIERS